MKRQFKCLAGFGIVLALLATGPTASAQETPAADTGKESADATSRATKRGSKAPAKVQELEALVIEGRIQKPEVFYVLGRTEARYKARELQKSFVDKVLTSVKDNPF